MHRYRFKLKSFPLVFSRQIKYYKHWSWDTPHVLLGFHKVTLCVQGAGLGNFGRVKNLDFRHPEWGCCLQSEHHKLARQAVFLFHSSGGWGLRSGVIIFQFRSSQLQMAPTFSLCPHMVEKLRSHSLVPSYNPIRLGLHPSDFFTFNLYLHVEEFEEQNLIPYAFLSSEVLGACWTQW
jgi:hypothetical protein